MSGLLDLRRGALRVVCAATARELFPHGDGESVSLGHGMALADGDLAVQLGSDGEGGWAALRQADRRALAEAIAPPGALIGRPAEIEPLLEGLRQGDTRVLPVAGDPNEHRDIESLILHGQQAPAAPAPEAGDAWMVSDDEERWSCTEEFATKAEAIAWGRAEFADDPRTLWVGRKVPYEIESIASYMADDVIQKLGEHAYDECHEEEWPNPTEEDRAVLGRALWLTLKQWIDEKCPPGFFRLEAVEEVEPIEEDDPIEPAPLLGDMSGGGA